MFVSFSSGKPRGSTIVFELDKPVGEIVSRGLLSELDSILEGNTSISKDYHCNFQEYWKVKQEHHNQLM